MVRCITVANGKGGVGKTTTCLELLSHASEKVGDGKVLGIDLDPSGNLGKRLTGLKHPDPGTPTINQFLKDPKSIKDPSDLFLPATTGWSNTYVIRSAPGLVELMLQIATQGGWDRKIKRLVDSIKPLFSFIVIDTGPTLGMLHTMAFKASDTVLVPADTGSDDALNAVHSIKTVINILAEDEPDCTNIKIYSFLAAVHKQNSIPFRIAKEAFIKELGNDFLEDITIPHRSYVGEAVWKHNPPIPAKMLAKKNDQLFTNYLKLSDMFL